MTAAIKTIEIRPARRVDLDGALEALNAFTLQQYGEAEYTEKSVLAEWDSGDIDLERDTRVAVDSAGKVVAFVEYWCDLIGSVERPECFLHVIPGLLAAEELAALLRFPIGRAEEALRETAVGGPIHLGTYVLADDLEKRACFESAGFREEWYSFKMLRELHAPIDTPVFPEGIAVRPLALGTDDRKVFEARSDAWRDMRGASPISFEQWRRYLIENAEHFDPNLWFIAWAGEDVAGFCLCSERTTEDPEMGFVPSLGVRKPYRNRGLATSLLLNAFGELYRRGVRKVGLDVDSESLTGANRIYERVGMRPVRKTIRYVRAIETSNP